MGEIITETTTVSNFKPEATISKDESFKGKYTTSEKAEVDKIVLSSDAYALGEMLQQLSDRLELLNNRLVR